MYRYGLSAICYLVVYVIKENRIDIGNKASIGIAVFKNMDFALMPKDSIIGYD